MDIELLVFDETEYFQEYDSPSFNYPYVPRKTIIESFKMNFDNLINSEPEYAVYKQNVKFKKTEACLE